MAIMPFICLCARFLADVLTSMAGNSLLAKKGKQVCSAFEFSDAETWSL